MKEIFEDEFRAIGTRIHIWVDVGDKEKNSIGNLVKKLKKFYLAKEKIFSRFDSKSELGFLNKNPGKYYKVSEDIINLAKKSLVYHKISGGFFDPRIIEILEKIGYDCDFSQIKKEKNFSIKNIPTFSRNLPEDIKIKNNEMMFLRKMDFSGIAKGYINDEAAKIIRNQGFHDFIIDSGGDMLSSGKEWEIEIEGVSGSMLKLKIKNTAVATSGITRRKWKLKEENFHHLINPKNPSHFCFSLKSATVIEKTTEKADVFAKALFLMGKDEGLKFADRNNLAVIFLDYRGNVFISKKAKKYIL